MVIYLESKHSYILAKRNRFWSQWDTYTASYNPATGRRTEQGWAYDAAGNVTQNPDMRLAYDAAGRNVRVESSDNSHVTTNVLDGDGQPVKRVETTPHPTTGQPETGTEYYLFSSVLGGKVVAWLLASGQKFEGYVYLGGEHITEQLRYSN